MALISLGSQQILIVDHQYKILAGNLSVQSHAHLEGYADRCGKSAELFGGGEVYLPHRYLHRFLHQAVNAESEVYLVGHELRTFHLDELRPDMGCVGEIEQADRFGVGGCDGVKLVFRGIHKHRVATLLHPGERKEAVGAHSALHHHRHPLAEPVVVVKFHRIGLHAHHLRAGHELGSDLTHKVRRRHHHMARCVGTSVEVDDHRLELSRIVVGQQQISFVAQGNMQGLGKISGDDHVAGYVFQLNRYLKIFLIGFPQCLKHPEYGRKGQEKKKNQELSVPQNGKTMPDT